MYAPSFTDDSFEVPYANIAAGLGVTLIPVAIGMTVLRKNPPVAAKLEKGAALLGGLFIAAAIAVGCMQNEDLFKSGHKLYLSSVFLAPCGYLAGYGLASLFGLPNRQRRTIALETGIQNSTLTIAIIMLTYPRGDAAANQKQEDVLAFAIMYSLFLVISGCIVTYLFRKISEGEEEEAEEGEAKKGEAAKHGEDEFFDTKEPRHEDDPGNRL